jgi:hypothetical protein
MVSKRAKIGIVAAIVIVSGLVGGSAIVYYYSGLYNPDQSASSTIPNTPLEPVVTIPGAPSEQEIASEITQASPNAEQDTNWNNLLNSCAKTRRPGANLTGSCDGRVMLELRNDSCETFDDMLLICDRNSALGEKFQSVIKFNRYT